MRAAAAGVILLAGAILGAAAHETSNRRWKI